MRRFFLPSEAIVGQTVTIEGELVHHMSHVLRLDVGEHITVCPGDGQAHEVVLTSFHKEVIVGNIVATEQVASETSVAVTLWQGMPKGDKLEMIIQKCTELGVERIVPVFTSRAVVKLDQAKATKKVERWQKIAVEASQQAKRTTIAHIEQPMNFKAMLQCLAQEDQSLTLVMWEDEVAQGLKQCLESQPLPAKINVVIGPEGGLSADEVDQLKAHGAYSVTLGKRILRTETAGMAALAMVLYHTGDLG